MNIIDLSESNNSATNRNKENKRKNKKVGSWCTMCFNPGVDEENPNTDQSDHSHQKVGKIRSTSRQKRHKGPWNTFATKVRNLFGQKKARPRVVKETFCRALFSERLLARRHGRCCHPVLKIGLGFSDKELQCSQQFTYTSSSFGKTNWDKLMSPVGKKRPDYSTYDEPIVDGHPASVWFAAFELSLASLIHLGRIKRRKSNLRRKRKAPHAFEIPPDPSPFGLMAGEGLNDWHLPIGPQIPIFRRGNFHFMPLPTAEINPLIFQSARQRDAIHGANAIIKKYTQLRERCRRTRLVVSRAYKKHLENHPPRRHTVNWQRLFDEFGIPIHVPFLVSPHTYSRRFPLVEDDMANKLFLRGNTNSNNSEEAFALQGWKGKRIKIDHCDPTILLDTLSEYETDEEHILMNTNQSADPPEEDLHWHSLSNRCKHSADTWMNDTLRRFQPRKTRPRLSTFKRIRKSWQEYFVGLESLDPNEAKVDKFVQYLAASPSVRRRFVKDVSKFTLDVEEGRHAAKIRPNSNLSPTPKTYKLSKNAQLIVEPTMLASPTDEAESNGYIKFSLTSCEPKSSTPAPGASKDTKSDIYFIPPSFPESTEKAMHITNNEISMTSVVNLDMKVEKAFEGPEIVPVITLPQEETVGDDNDFGVSLSPCSTVSMINYESSGPNEQAKIEVKDTCPTAESDKGEVQDDEQLPKPSLSSEYLIVNFEDVCGSGTITSESENSDPSDAEDLYQPPPPLPEHKPDGKACVIIMDDSSRFNGKYFLTKAKLPPIKTRNPQLQQLNPLVETNSLQRKNNCCKTDRHAPPSKHQPESSNQHENREQDLAVTFGKTGIQQNESSTGLQTSFLPGNHSCNSRFRSKIPVPVATNGTPGCRIRVRNEPHPAYAQVADEIHEIEEEQPSTKSQPMSTSSKNPTSKK